MTRQNLQMMFSVLVIVTLSVIGGEPQGVELAPEPASLVAPSEEPGVEEIGEVGVAEEQPAEEATNEVVLPGSFNEMELESEFNEVQTGIDLLDSPLQ